TGRSSLQTASTCLRIRFCSSVVSRLILEALTKPPDTSVRPPFRVHPLIDVVDYLFQRRAWSIEPRYAELQQLRLVFVRDYPTADHDYVPAPLLLDQLLHLRKRRHVGAVEEG